MTLTFTTSETMKLSFVGVSRYVSHERVLMTELFAT